MKKLFQYGIPATIVSLGLALSTMSYASPKIVKDTGVKNCKACHTQGKVLNEAGTCYKEKKDLKACNIPVPAPAK